MKENYTYKEIADLLGCYIIIADKEINQMEVDILDKYMPFSKEDCLYKGKHAPAL